ncbi:hypothetical protein CsSME_00035403 [Camellia sinensis var. sinensis]
MQLIMGKCSRITQGVGKRLKEMGRGANSATTSTSTTMGFILTSRRTTMQLPTTLPIMPAFPVIITGNLTTINTSTFVPRLGDMAVLWSRRNNESRAILDKLMNHSTTPALFLLNISICLTHNGKRISAKNLNTNLIILNVKTSKKILDILLGHHQLKGSSILSHAGKTFGLRSSKSHELCPSKQRRG